jgi:RNA polymerase sigma-70 factor (ECF subfamily)
MLTPLTPPPTTTTSAVSVTPHTLSCGESGWPFHNPAGTVSSAMMGAQPFETIVGAHHAEIFRYLRRVTTRATEAEDLSQETFLRAYRAYRTLGPEANVRAWLFAIATNLTRNHFRSEKRRRVAYQAASVERSGADHGGPEDEARLREARTRLETTIGQLPLKQRQAFIMRKMHDLDYEAIGQSLDCSGETARAHVFQALRKIRLSLNGHELPPTRDREAGRAPREASPTTMEPPR